MTTVLPPVCMECRHFQGNRRCAAFSGEIPDVIWWGRSTHEEAVEGDHGIRFSLIPGSPVPIQIQSRTTTPS